MSKRHVFLAVALSVLFLFPARAWGDQFLGKEILTGTWKGEVVEYLEGEILFMIQNGESRAEVALYLDQNDLNLAREVDHFGFGKVSLRQGENIFPEIERMQATGYFLYVEPNMIDRLCLEPDDPEYLAQKQWGLHNVGQNPPGGTPDADIDAPQAWDSTTGTSGVLVAVLDSGIPMELGRLSHPDLDDRSKIVVGSDITEDGEGVTDRNGHGTHVAGIISAETNNGIGVAGVCWNCKILVNQVFDAYGSGSHENFRDGMIYSVNCGADLVNYSGGGSHSATKEHGVAYADSHDVLLVAAAGNNWGGSVSYPGAYAAWYGNVICVSSTDPTDQVSAFSSIGSEVSVAAPGGSGSPYDADDIYSTMPNYHVNLNDYGISQNYGYCAGTSMASPMVAGLAALVKSVDPTLLPSEVREVIEETAEQVGGYYYDPVSGKCTQLGHGRVNAHDAVLLLLQSSYVAGDANGDGAIDVADPIYVLNYLYKDGPAPVPLAAGDANADCAVDLADAIYLLNYLYKGGAPPQNGCA